MLESRCQSDPSDDYSVAISAVHVFGTANLDSAEHDLTEAVRLKPYSPRPHNNLGRVLLRRSQQFDVDARDGGNQGKIDPSEAAKAKKLRDEAKTKLNLAIEQFEKAIELEPSLLEPRLNLGEVYLSLSDRDKAENNLAKSEDDRDKAEKHYQEILKLKSPNVKDRETISNFSQASFGLARIAILRKNSDAAIERLQEALELNPQNIGAMQLLTLQRFQRGEYREGEKVLWSLMAVLPAGNRRTVAEQLGGQLEGAGNPKAALQAWNFMAWAFATSADPHNLDPEEAMKIAKHVLEMTQRPGSAGTRHVGRGPGRQRPVQASYSNCPGRDRFGEFPTQQVPSRGHCVPNAALSTRKILSIRPQRQR